MPSGCRSHSDLQICTKCCAVQVVFRPVPPQKGLWHSSAPEGSDLVMYIELDVDFPGVLRGGREPQYMLRSAPASSVCRSLSDLCHPRRVWDIALDDWGSLPPLNTPGKSTSSSLYMTKSDPSGALLCHRPFWGGTGRKTTCTAQHFLATCTLLIKEHRYVLFLIILS